METPGKAVKESKKERETEYRKRKRNREKGERERGRGRERERERNGGINTTQGRERGNCLVFSYTQYLARTLYWLNPVKSQLGKCTLQGSATMRKNRGGLENGSEC